MSDTLPETVSLPDEFVQPVLSDLKSHIDELFEKGSNVQLDASKVSRIDSAALQFLVAFANCDLASIPCVANMEDSLSTALADIGVSDEEIEHLYGGAMVDGEKAA